MITNLYAETLYTIPSNFIIHPIYEYDIRKANISILLNEGCITQDQYDYLYRAPNDERKVTIGLMQRDNPKLSDILNEGFKKARYNLVYHNNIQDEDIISIRKDAMFITRPLRYTNFGCINFIRKGVYSMMIKVNKLEIYFNLREDGYDLDVKGIKDEKLDKHQPFYLSALCEILSEIQLKKFDSAVHYILDFIRQYNSFKLPVGFYREFNHTSLFRINTFNSVFYIDDISENDLLNLDISANQAFNRELYKVISMIYFTYVRKPNRF